MIKKILFCITMAFVLLMSNKTSAFADSEPWNGYVDSWGNYVPGLITNETWMSPMPSYVSGKAVFYGPYAMDATAEYRGIDYEKEGCIGGVSLMSPIDIGKTAWAKIDGVWHGPFCVVDCARRGDMYSIVVYREEVIELNFETAVKVGMVSQHNEYGSYEVYDWYKDVEVLVNVSPEDFMKNQPLSKQNTLPAVYKDYFLNTLKFATGFEPRIILTSDGVWKEFGRETYWRYARSERPERSGAISFLVMTRH